MTAGCDIRPVTASGSIRMSDVAHQRNLRTAEIESDDLERRAARTLVLEEIEDFEHKLGWKMRKNLGEPLRARVLLSFAPSRVLACALAYLCVGRPSPPPLSPPPLRCLLPRLPPSPLTLMSAQGRAGKNNGTWR